MGVALLAEYERHRVSPSINGVSLDDTPSSWRIVGVDRARFLDRQIGPSWVVADNGLTVACGGVTLDHPETGIATLYWGMVAANKHRHGIGSALLQHRINYVATERPATRLPRANTTQLAQGFFERHGFVAVQVVTGG